MIGHSQNFLLNKRIVENIIERLDISPEDVIIDIGAGEGVITEMINRKVQGKGKIYAVEIENELVRRLQNRYEESPNITVVEANISNYELPKGDYKVIANIPFNITSEILNKILNPKGSLKEAYLILQEEAALMYAGEALSGESTLKSLLLYPFFDFKILHYFTPSDFMPEPKVSIIFLEIKRREKSFITPELIDEYNNFLTYISQDKVGEGSWKDVFTRKQLEIMSKASNLEIGRGLKSQHSDSILNAFKSYLKYTTPQKKKEIEKAVEKIKIERSKVVKIHRTRQDREWHQKGM
ncbi:rRNA adenine N(6)-methyltransferase family protein [Candidatus Dojkabacteria bacterium]|nr:rRNA adenine N(6)-methyltransferase family protein [Candidatus Dojkabacteria bacterium]